MNGAWKGKEQLLATLVCAAEERGMSAHPLALAIFIRLLPMSGDFWSKFRDVGGARKLLETPGRGIKCEVNPSDGLWRAVSVGNLAGMKENNVRGIDVLPLKIDREGPAVFIGI